MPMLQNLLTETQPCLCAPPSPNEMSDPYTELSIVEAEVEVVSATLAKLIGRVHLLKERINDVHSTIIRILPPEITTEIFYFCIPAFESYEPKQNLSIPLLLSSVCTAWRRAAFSTPSLWSSLSLRFSSNNMTAQTELLSQWLSRSGELPLSIRLIFSDEVNWSSPSNPEDALKFVNQYCHRWLRLDLRLPTSCYNFLPTTQELPMLQAIQLNPPGGQGDRKHQVELRHAPKLQHLTLSCIYLFSVQFSWDTITHLQLESFYVDECVAALSNTTQLRSCVIQNIIGGEDGHPLPDQPIELNQLETLIIDNEKEANVTLIFEKLTVPKLRELSYSGGTLLHIPQLCAMIERSGCSIESFSFIDAQATEQYFLNLLRHMTSLTTLVLQPRGTLVSLLTNYLLNSCNPWLSRLNKTDCMLPNLQSLVYRGPQTFVWSFLLEALESRRADSRHPATQPTGGDHYIEVSALKDVDISLMSSYNLKLDVELDEDHLLRLRKLEGMNIQISSSYSNSTTTIYQTPSRC